MSLFLPHRRTLGQAAALAGLALAAGLLSNLTASGPRRLGWTERPIDPSAAARLQSGAAPAQATTSATTSATTASTPTSTSAPGAVPDPSPKAPPQPSAVPAPKPIAPQALFPADPASPVREISGAEATRAHGGRVRFLDARRSADYTAGHIPGAWCIPVWESDVDARITVFEASSGPSSKDPIVLYCSGGDCEDSHMLASRLMKLGYRNLLIYKAGYPDWMAQGHPVRKGEEP